MTLSPDRRKEITDRGWAARRLLAEPDFVLVVNALAHEKHLAMADTPLGEVGRTEREEHHLMLHGLRAVVDAVKQATVALTNLEHLDRLDAASKEADEDPDDHGV